MKDKFLNEEDRLMNFCFDKLNQKIAISLLFVDHDSRFYLKSNDNEDDNEDEDDNDNDNDNEDEDNEDYNEDEDNFEKEKEKYFEFVEFIDQKLQDYNNSAFPAQFDQIGTKIKIETAKKLAEARKININFINEHSICNENLLQTYDKFIMFFHRKIESQDKFNGLNKSLLLSRLIFEKYNVFILYSQITIKLNKLKKKPQINTETSNINEIEADKLLNDTINFFLTNNINIVDKENSGKFGNSSLFVKSETNNKYEKKDINQYELKDKILEDIFDISKIYFGISIKKHKHGKNSINILTDLQKELMENEDIPSVIGVFSPLVELMTIAANIYFDKKIIILPTTMSNILRKAIPDNLKKKLKNENKITLEIRNAYVVDNFEAWSFLHYTEEIIDDNEITESILTVLRKAIVHRKKILCMCKLYTRLLCENECDDAGQLKALQKLYQCQINEKFFNMELLNFMMECRSLRRYILNIKNETTLEGQPWVHELFKEYKNERDNIKNNQKELNLQQKRIWESTKWTEEMLKKAWKEFQHCKYDVEEIPKILKKLQNSDRNFKEVEEWDLCFQMQHINNKLDIDMIEEEKMLQDEKEKIITELVNDELNKKKKKAKTKAFTMNHIFYFMLKSWFPMPQSKYFNKHQCYQTLKLQNMEINLDIMKNIKSESLYTEIINCCKKYRERLGKLREELFSTELIAKIIEAQTIPLHEEVSRFLKNIATLNNYLNKNEIIDKHFVDTLKGE
jgi:hypothetical protein